LELDPAINIYGTFSHRAFVFGFIGLVTDLELEQELERKGIKRGKTGNMEAETLEQMQARHRRELKDLQGRITSKKKNATKKTRKGVNDECAEMERQLREKQASEVAALNGEVEEDVEEEGQEQEQNDETPSGTEALENATAKLKIEEGNDSTAQQQQQPGKKRNRQKERLARRAAEQEAAMLSAEQEASSMTDHRARESTYMKNAFATHKLTEKDIQPDGHCLFSALADQLSHNGIPLGGKEGEGKEPAYKTIRKTATGYMEEHADDFAPFLEEDFGGYVKKMRDTAEWGGQLELMAVARRYGVEIKVIQDGRTENISGKEGEGEGDETKTLWLAYYRHGYGLGEHYNSLRRATTTTTAAKTAD
jgi:OTU domain-containing protein 6